MTGSGRLARGLAAVAALVGIVGGIPAALVLWGTSPVQGELSGGSLRDLADDMGSERVVAGVLTVAAWLVWLLFLRALVMEVLAHRRAGPPAGGVEASGPAGPGPLRRLARGLVIWSTMAAGSFGPLAGGAGAAPPPPLAAVLPAESVAPEVRPPVEPPARLAAPAPAAVPDADLGETVVAIDGPTDAWTLAEEHLGDGTRWNELWEANRDRVQPDGTRWHDPEATILAGWRLVIPTAEGPGEAAPAAEPLREVVVAEGDHFWGLAERELATAWGRPPTADEITPYWRQMVEANRERLVPPGDPDLILPGQVLVTPPVPLEEAALRARVALVPAEAAEVSDAPGTGDGDETAAGPSQDAEAIPESPVREVPDEPGEADEAEPDDGEPDDGVLDIAPWAAAGVPALLAAGITWRIGRLRGERLRRRARDDGDAVPVPAGEAQVTELRWRAIADGEAAEWVDAALRYLRRAVRQSRQTVSLMGVRTGPDGLELLLGELCDEAAPGFVAERSGWIWRLLCDDLREITELAADEQPYAQGLVTLGRTDAGATALVDVEHLGVVSVEGDAEHVRTWLMGVSLEVATASWADGVQLHLVGGLTELGALESVTLLEGAGATPVVRRAVTAPTAAPLTVVVACEPVDASVVGAAEPGRGAAVVAAGPVDGATWRLVAGADGRAHLYPFGLAVTLSGVDQRTALDTAHLLTDAAAPAPAVADLPDRASVLLDPRPLRAEPVDPALEEKYDTLVASILEPGEIEVAVLGQPTVTGWKREPRDRSVEIVVYLATHEGPVPGERLRDRVFPPGFTGRSLAEAVSRTRRALGSSASSGDDHLLPARERTYQLGPGVRSDLSRYRRLHAAAQQAPVACEVKLLRAALALVRAQPFSDCPAGGYGWADAESLSYELQAMIADDAQRLAELALGCGEAALAEWAARQGLRASPGNESLFCDLATAKYHQGDVGGFRAVVDEARAFAARIDPLDGLQPRTHRLFGEIAAAFARAQHRAAIS